MILKIICIFIFSLTLYSIQFILNKYIEEKEREYYKRIDNDFE
jgi:hypothetical protein